jgi:hypothetical protein
MFRLLGFTALTKYKKSTVKIRSINAYNGSTLTSSCPSTAYMISLVQRNFSSTTGIYTEYKHVYIYLYIHMYMYIYVYIIIGRDFVQWVPPSGPRKVWEPKQEITRVKSSNQLKFEIEAVFLRSNVLQDDVDKFIFNNLKNCDIESISNLMHISVKASKNQDKIFLRKHLQSIAKR